MGQFRRVTLAEEQRANREHKLRPKPARQSSTLPVRDGDGKVLIYSATTPRGEIWRTIR